MPVAHDVIGACGTSQASPTSRKLIAAMGGAWLAQVCESRSEATLVGMKATAAQDYFAQGYNVTAPAGAPRADAVFSHIHAPKKWVSAVNPRLGGHPEALCLPQGGDSTSRICNSCCDRSSSCWSCRIRWS